MAEHAYTKHDMPEHERALSAELEQREWEEDDTRVLPDAKPTKRYRASQKEWGHLRNVFANTRCAICDGNWDSLHHVYPRGQGGDDTAVNLIALCGSGTTGCHGRVEAHDPAARAAVRASLNDAHRWYLTWKLGHGAQAWLDSQYPELEVAA